MSECLVHTRNAIPEEPTALTIIEAVDMKTSELLNDTEFGLYFPKFWKLLHEVT